MEGILDILSKTGTVLTKFYRKRRPDRKLFTIRLDTGQIVWFSQDGGLKQLEGLIDIRTIREVRQDRNSREFDRLSEEARKYEKTQCFVIHYGMEFRLATISCVAESTEVAKQWTDALNYLVLDLASASHLNLLNRWMRSLYHGRNYRVAITLDDLKNIMFGLHYKIPLPALVEAFQEFNGNYRGEIDFQAFIALCQKFSGMEKVFYAYFAAYSKTGKSLSLHEFRHFLEREQGMTWDKTEEQFKEYVRTLRHESKNDSDDICLTLTEFLEYLYSEDNSIWDSTHDVVNQSMDHPLTHYWIASSHNTYLTGNQFTSDSSVEAYVRCLRMGSRCIELDVWDGPDNMPVIYHGRTLTSQIRFIDVLEAIRDHAFVTSDYPVILSIEEHCGLPQQRQMARLFKSTFGDKLVTQQVDRNETAMPSPEQLRGKIIIKHKRIPDGEETSSQLVTSLSASSEDEFSSDSSNNLRRKGVMYLEHPDTHEWIAYDFALSSTMLCYMAPQEDNENEASSSETEDSENRLRVHARGSDYLHFAEPWFHGRLIDGREEAEDLLRYYGFMGDGTFLVRNSVTYPGDYALSFIRGGDFHHCNIHKEPDSRHGQKFFLRGGGNKGKDFVNGVEFHSLCDLIAHYRENPVRSENFHITLKEPVPQQQPHKDAEWFYEAVKRKEAENILRTVDRDGAFLVRPSETKEGEFVLTFVTDHEVKHCRIARNGRLFVIGPDLFETLVELVAYFKNVPLYHKTSLQYPVNQELVDHATCRENSYAINGDNQCAEYMVLSISCRALYDYHAQQPNELSFVKGIVITNVLKHDHGWWRGNYEDKIEHWFPSNYVEEIFDQAGEGHSIDDKNILGPKQLGSINLSACTIRSLPGGQSGRDYVFRLKSIDKLGAIDISCDDLEDMNGWMENIRDAIREFQQQNLQQIKHEKNFHCAKELSELIVYCYNIVGAKFNPLGRDFRQIFSFSENCGNSRAAPEDCKTFLKYNERCLTRIYPGGRRVNSANYDPIRTWNCGSQMVALNYQTGDTHMQLNQSRFLQNGRCGYVLQPEFMRSESYDPYDAATLKGLVEPMLLSVTIMAARHLTKAGKGIVSPCVEVEVTGADYDCSKYKTETVQENGFNPVWNEACDFDIHNPDIALIRFVVQDIDIFGDLNFVGQATYPVRCIRSGYRAVPLKNGWSETLDMASLLVKIQLKPIKDEDRVLYKEIQNLRHGAKDLSRRIDELKGTGNNLTARRLAVKLIETENLLRRKTTERSQKDTMPNLPNLKQKTSGKKFWDFRLSLPLTSREPSSAARRASEPEQRPALPAIPHGNVLSDLNYSSSPYSLGDRIYMSISPPPMQTLHAQTSSSPNTTSEPRGRAKFGRLKSALQKMLPASGNG